MFESYLKTCVLVARLRADLKRLCTDRDGTVSWEYLLVAAVVIIAVGTAFGPAANSGIEKALANGISDIVADFTAEI